MILPPTSPSTTRAPWPWLLDSLREAGAEEQVAALAERAAAHVSLDDPFDVARLLGSLRAAGVEAAALLARDPAAQVSLDDPRAVARLLDSLRAAGAEEQAAALLARDPAAQVSLDDPRAVAGLLDSLRASGAEEQAAALLTVIPPPTSPSTTRAPWPGCWTACGHRAQQSRPPRWPSAPPPTSPSTTRAPWPGCWTACGHRAQQSRPPRWPTGCRGQACSSSSAGKRAARIGSGSAGRLMADQLGYGAGPIWIDAARLSHT